MSPWSRAETGDEQSDRALFARRASALEAAAVPSLAAVLRAVDRSREEQEARRARGRAIIGMMLAAACVAASMTSLPHGAFTGARDFGIGADLDAGAATAARSVRGAGVTELAGEACESQAEQDPLAMSTAPPACFAPPASFTLSTRYESACETRETRSTLICASDETCSTAAPMSY